MKKNKTLQFRSALIVTVALIGNYMVFGPRRVPNAQDFTWNGLRANLEENVNLGLDLKGGSHLVMRVLTEDYLKTLTENNAQAALTAATDAKLPVTGTNIVAQEGNYSITLQLGDAAQGEAVAETVRQKVDLINWSEDIGDNAITWSLPSNA